MINPARHKPVIHRKKNRKWWKWDKEQIILKKENKLWESGFKSLTHKRPQLWAQPLVIASYWCFQRRGNPPKTICGHTDQQAGPICPRGLAKASEGRKRAPVRHLVHCAHKEGASKGCKSESWCTWISPEAHPFPTAVLLKPRWSSLPGST